MIHSSFSHLALTLLAFIGLSACSSEPPAVDETVAGESLWVEHKAVKADQVMEPVGDGPNAHQWRLRIRVDLAKDCGGKRFASSDFPNIVRFVLPPLQKSIDTDMAKACPTGVFTVEAMNNPEASGGVLTGFDVTILVSSKDGSPGKRDRLYYDFYEVANTFETTLGLLLADYINPTLATPCGSSAHYVPRGGLTSKAAVEAYCWSHSMVRIEMADPAAPESVTNPAKVIFAGSASISTDIAPAPYSPIATAAICSSYAARKCAPLARNNRADILRQAVTGKHTESAQSQCLRYCQTRNLPQGEIKACSALCGTEMFSIGLAIARPMEGVTTNVDNRAFGGGDCKPIMGSIFVYP